MTDNRQFREAADDTEGKRSVDETKSATNDYLQGAVQTPTDSHSTMAEENQSSSYEKTGLDIETDADEAATKSPPEAKPHVPSSEGQSKTETETQTQTRTSLLLLGIGLAVLLVALDNTILSTAIPRIVDQLHALHDVSWYGSAYLLTNCSFQLVFGAMYTSFSLKGTLLSAILFFEVGSVICGGATTSSALIVGRAIAGIGAAGIFQGAFMVVAVSVVPHKRPIYNGLFGAVYGIASIVAPLMGGALTEYASWRWCFYINLPVGAVTVASIFLFLRLPEAKVKMPRTVKEFTLAVRKMDPWGLFVFLPSIVCLLLALVWGGEQYEWSDGRIIALLVVFGVLMIAFGFIETHSSNSEYAILRPRLLRQRNVVCGGLFAFLLATSNFTIGYYMPLWFQAVKGVAPTKSGVMSLPTMLSMVIASFIAGGSITRFGEYLPFFYLSSIFASVGAGLISTFRVDTSHSAWIGFQVIFGMGLGLGVQLPITLVQVSCPREDIAAATSVMVFCQILGGAVFIAVAQSVIARSLTHGVQQGLPDIAPVVLENLTATSWVSSVPPDQVNLVRQIFNDALTSAWHIAAGMAAVTIVAAVGVKRVRFGKKKTNTEMATETKG